jgi:hypothetical protein
MSDYPRNQIAPPLIHSYSRYSVGPHLHNLTGASPAAQNWTANTAVYMPLYLPWPYNVRRMFWVNGTAGGNSDIGIYSIGGGKLYSSGSTANTGSGSSPQYVTLATDVLLGPGAYFLAWANDGTSSRAFGTAPTASLGRIAGLYQQATALPLPALATFAAFAGVGAPWIGISNLDSGF